MSTSDTVNGDFSELHSLHLPCEHIFGSHNHHGIEMKTKSKHVYLFKKYISGIQNIFHTPWCLCFWLDHHSGCQLSSNLHLQYGNRSLFSLKNTLATVNWRLKEQKQSNDLKWVTGTFYLPASVSSDLTECSHIKETLETEIGIWSGFLNPISTLIASARGQGTKYQVTTKAYHCSKACIPYFYIFKWMLFIGKHPMHMFIVEEIMWKALMSKNFSSEWVSY